MCTLLHPGKCFEELNLQSNFEDDYCNWLEWIQRQFVSSEFCTPT